MVVEEGEDLITITTILDAVVLAEKDKDATSLLIIITILIIIVEIPHLIADRHLEVVIKEIADPHKCVDHLCHLEETHHPSKEDPENALMLSVTEEILQIEECLDHLFKEGKVRHNIINSSNNNNNIIDEHLLHREVEEIVIPRIGTVQ